MKKAIINLAAVCCVVLLTALPGQGYQLEGFDWTYLGGNPVTVDYKVNPNCADPTAPNELASCQSAMGTWSSAGANFAYYYDGYTSTVGYVYNGQNSISWSNGGGGALATTYMWYQGSNMVEADVVFWDEWTWNTSNPSIPQFDVESVGLHELGHSLGLAHSQYNWAVMWSSIGYAEVQRELSSDDIAGILAIYGPGGSQNIEVTLTPYGTPIQIPPGGGSFEYNLEITNNETSTASFDFWVMVRLPNWTYYGPVLGPAPLTFAPGFSGSRNRTQYIPAGAPSGTYYYIGYVGYYSSTVFDSSYFTFQKSNTDGGGYIAGWDNRGEDLFWMENTGLAVPDKISLSAYPNPFNPSVTLNFCLKESDKISVTVYNLEGREVFDSGAGYYPPGVNQIEIDGSNWSNGVYFAKLTSSRSIALCKMLLVK